MTPSLPPTQTNLPRPRALLFDLDGLLLNTESLYVSCIEQVLNAHLPSTHKPLKLPWTLLAIVQGRPAPIAHGLILEWAGIPELTKHPEIYFEELKKLEEVWFKRARVLPGVERLLRNVSRIGIAEEVEGKEEERGKEGEGKIHTALVTSSHTIPFSWKTSHLSSSPSTNILQYIPRQNRVLGDDPRLPPGKGKPHPDIYLLALSVLNEQIRGVEREIEPDECLVFEDGVVGVTAARRAGMQAVWVPDRGLRELYRGREEVVLRGEGMDVDVESEGEKNEDGDGDEEGVGNGRASEGRNGINGANGLNGHEKENGEKGKQNWGICLNSLEEFPYERYGFVASSSKENGK